MSAAVAAPAGFSLYDLDGSTWTDQSGRERVLDSLSGRPLVLAMVYTSCTYACPRIVAELKRIEAELGTVSGDVGFVMVSIDPDRDTPAAIAAYAAATQLSQPAWTILTGDAKGVLELASVLGVRYRRLDGGEFEHANVLTVLDARGRVLHRQDGLGEGREMTVSVLRDAARASAAAAKTAAVAPAPGHAAHLPPRR